MQSRIARLTLLAAAVAFTPLAFAAQAGSAQPAGSAAPQMQVQHRSILDELNLTESQQQQVRAAMQQSMQELRPQAQALDQRRATFEQTQPGTSGYQASVNSLAQAESDFARTRVQHEGALRAKVYGMLTQAQRTKLQQLLAQQRERIQQMRAQQQSRQTQPAASH